MSNKKAENNNRRKLLKSAAITGGVVSASGLMADKWAKPIVNAVVLPVHAQTTGAQRYLLDIFDIFEVMNDIQNKGQMITQKAKDLLIAPANAQVEQNYIIYLEQISGDMYKFVYTFENPTFFEYASTELTVGVQKSVFFESCVNDAPGGFNANVTLVSINGEEAELIIAFDGDVNITAPFNANAVEPENQVCEEVSS